MLNEKLEFTIAIGLNKDKADFALHLEGKRHKLGVYAIEKQDDIIKIIQDFIYSTNIDRDFINKLKQTLPPTISL
jgi:uncharacterized Fe-S cluster-containing protein